MPSKHPRSVTPQRAARLARLRDLVAIAATDFTTVGTPGWAATRRRLANVASTAAAGMLSRAPTADRCWPIPAATRLRGEAPAVQRQVGELLSRLCPPASAAAPADGEWAVPVRISRLVVAWDRVGPAVRVTTIPYTADWRSAFWSGALETLEQVGSLLRRCEHCQRLFVAQTKRARYHSAACSLAGRQKKYRHGHRDQVLAQRRRAYRRRLGKRDREDGD